MRLDHEKDTLAFGMTSANLYPLTLRLAGLQAWGAFIPSHVRLRFDFGWWVHPLSRPSLAKPERPARLLRCSFAPRPTQNHAAPRYNYYRLLIFVAVVILRQQSRLSTCCRSRPNGVFLAGVRYPPETCAQEYVSAAALGRSLLACGGSLFPRGAFRLLPSAGKPFIPLQRYRCKRSSECANAPRRVRAGETGAS